MEISVAASHLQTPSRHGRSRRAAGRRRGGRRRIDARPACRGRAVPVGQDRRARRRDGGVAAGAGALGTEVRLVLPGFTPFLDAFELTEIARLRTPFAVERVRIALARLPDSAVAAYLVDHPAFYDRPGTPYQAPDGTRLARQPPALRAAGLGGGGAGARRRPGMAARSAALPRLARRPRPGLSAGAGRRGAERLHRAQHRVSGIFPGLVLWRSGACRRAFSRSTGSSSMAGWPSSRPGCSTPTG